MQNQALISCHTPEQRRPVSTSRKSFFARIVLYLMLMLVLLWQIKPVQSLTLSGAVKKYGTAARERIRPYFEAQHVAYPPRKITLVGLKEEMVLAVFVTSNDGSIHHVMTYPILAASGEVGPKLKQGDLQVPEGFYKIIAFNPGSLYHLSLRVDYPNSVDRVHARRDKRTKLGGDIMIHGDEVSAGCLAMGDDGIEELFVLLYDTGLANASLILAPCDLTAKRPTVKMKVQPRWLPDLYLQMKHALGVLVDGATKSRRALNRSVAGSKRDVNRVCED